MEENEQLKVLMAGFRGTNLDESDFASDSVKMRLVTDFRDEGLGAALPLSYDPDAINRCAARCSCGWRAERCGARSTSPRMSLSLLAPACSTRRRDCCAAPPHALCCLPPACNLASCRYWDTRPTAVITRITQLLSIAGSFLGGLASDLLRGARRRDRPAAAEKSSGSSGWQQQ